ncbi:hypothetical protein K458DRAFT_395121 [Lentithecium fluviatile CBS 122367]|uniref:DnaJ homologue subfamily C member 28 conserved domain-containing protein n=1 Tax=Lentithecium fluviatile CBS 122367 TaxID=1168545 RepID=A0A6G1IJ89_9PLEO|nr:hypothetical protein K458DRAFT_395121 [Lentithecium fluviatile CBS 122367]
MSSPRSGTWVSEHDMVAQHEWVVLHVSLIDRLFRWDQCLGSEPGCWNVTVCQVACQDSCEAGLNCCTRLQASNLMFSNQTSGKCAGEAECYVMPTEEMGLRRKANPISAAILNDDVLETLLRSPPTRTLLVLSNCLHITYSYMPPSSVFSPYTCARCLRAKRGLPGSAQVRRIAPLRRYAESAAQRKDEDGEREEGNSGIKSEDRQLGIEEKDEGAMSRRLRDMSEEALESGGRSTQKDVSEAGFSEELKRQLEERIASASFRADNRSAFAEVELPSAAGRHTRDLATADPWSGTESIHDASLRMLNDAHKPLKVRGGRMGTPGAQLPRSIDTGRKSKVATGTRLANARDRSGLYSSLKDSDIDEQERQKRFQELKDRFSPHARAVVPGTIQGLASLANERIEDAIARGQFKNLPNRGKQVERDYNASNPFLDTTEYFMNKIIQKQEIVPPWIEKQQELVATANKFRSRLRADWKRHAARVIASKGGTLQNQMKRAEAYAKAELIANPQKKKHETMNAVDDHGHLSQISLSSELSVPSPTSPDTEVTEEIVDQRSTIASDNFLAPGQSSQSIQVPLSYTTSTTTVPPAPYPFRDPAWETTESAYHTLAIADLNSKTRSYNLQAPDLAKKPYFSLQRELNACYADIAPQLANAIKERATKPVLKVEGFGQSLAGGGGVMDRLVGEKVRVRDERTEKQYGFKQFWKDVWGAKTSV